MVGAKPRWLLALVSLLGIVVILISTSRYGVGLSPDSVGYVAAARNLLVRRGLVSYDGSPLVIWQPLYPLFLSSIGYLLSSDPLSCAAAANAALYGLILYLSGTLLFWHTKSIKLTILGLLLAASWPLTKIAVMAWSEPLFICFVLLFLICLEFYLAAREAKWLLAMSLFAALASLTRHVGAALMLTGLLSLWLNSRQPWKTKLAHGALFALLSATPMTLWAVRTWTVCGSFFGPRHPSPYSPLENALFLLEGIYFWFLPDHVLDSPFLIIGLTVLALILFSLTFVLFKRHSSFDDQRLLKEALLGMRHLIIFILCYMGPLLLTAMITSVSLGVRMLSPVYVPLFLLALRLAQEFAALLKKRFLQPLVNRLLIAIACLLAFGAGAEIAGITVLRAVRGAGGYNVAFWRKSETIQSLRRRFDADALYYSNAPDAIYILADLQTRMSPTKRAEASADKALTTLKNRWPPSPHANLVWFDRCHRDYLFSVGELQSVAEISLQVRLSDGAIYAVSPKRE